MRNVLLTFALLLTFGLSFGQIKVVTSGDVGIGTSTPSTSLTVEGTGISLNSPGSNKNSVAGTDNSRRLAMTSGTSSSASSAFFTMWGDETHGEAGANPARAGELAIQCGYFQVSTAKPVPGFAADVDFDVDAAGNVNTFGGTTSSSYRMIADDKMQKNSSNFKYGLNEVLQMEPKEFTQELRSKSKANQVVVSAQQMAKIAPEIVGTVEYNDYENKVHETYETIDMTAVTFMLVNSIKEQQALIDAQNERIAEMEATILNMANGATTQTVEIRDSRLGQNAPNPFTQATVINYTVPTKAQTAVMQVFDMNGNLLKSVNVANGNGQLTINAGELAAGTYSYNLVVDGAIVDTKKMILTK